MKNINYTFIIPHKNIPDLLQRCLNSIPRREDIQIIVVDDNSDPDKVDFEHFPGVGEPCVEVYFTKEGKGAGYARNVGLKHAKGKWLLFADADDYFKNVDILLDKCKYSVEDIIFFNSLSVNTINKLTSFGDQINNAMSAYPDEKLKNYLRFYCGVPWCKVVNRNLLEKHKIFFDEIPKHNDTMFSLKVGYYASNIGIDKNIYYVNCCRSNSISNKSNYVNTLHSTIKVAVDYYLFAYAHGINDYDRLIVCYRLYEAYRKKQLITALRYIGIRNILKINLVENMFRLVAFSIKRKCKIGKSYEF